ncbi:MAG: transposase [Bacteroidaceae bacterium]|nr:transposase [Bacteroidaceae bacterium]
MSDRRTIEVNHQVNAYRAEAKRLLTSERGLYHRSNRPIEPEAVFGDIKQNHGFKRFKLLGSSTKRNRGEEFEPGGSVDCL